jgi:hypothetical protein
MFHYYVAFLLHFQYIVVMSVRLLMGLSLHNALVLGDGSDSASVETPAWAKKALREILARIG